MRGAVAGLDDSVTEMDVVEAIARVGACSADDVKVAGIRRNSVGLGAAFVRCPVSAAKKIACHLRWIGELALASHGVAWASLNEPPCEVRQIPRYGFGACRWEYCASAFDGVGTEIFAKPMMPTNTASDGGEKSDCSNISVSSCVSTASEMRRVAQKRNRKPDNGETDIEEKET
ncbi:reverse transcriptase [Operophtera brumata]|uniref:Reverse transcriptase n=1 Tax=Operophtera brumata TaxID=104452 RepID=A0A0L7L4C1_OPEBR|nr:reverse transcriptase [Operophtera brumata]